MSKRILYLISLLCIVSTVSFFAGCYRESIIHKAAATDDLAVLQEQLRITDERGRLVNSKDDNGNTPLHIAVQHDRLTAARFLFANGADISIKNATGETPLDLAIKARNKRMVDWVKLQELCVAAQQGDMKNARCLVKSGVDVNGTYSGLSVYRNDTPIDIAASNGHREIVRLLIGNGASVNVHKAGEISTLMQAVLGGYERIIDDLITSGARINDKDGDGNTALHLAAGLGEKDVVIQLIKNGADINARNVDGQTPLLCAVSLKQVNTARILVERGANVNIADKEGCNPLYVAKKFGLNDLVKVLEINGAR